MFVCVFFSHGASYNFMVGYSLSLGRIMSSNKLESFPIRFIGKYYSTWEFQFKLFVKGKNCGVILMGVFPHLKVSRLYLSGKFMMLGL